MIPPEIAGVYETVLYASDVPETVAFYRDVLGLRAVDDFDGLGAALRLPDGGVLLVFDPDASARPGRAVPSHGTTGSGHVAFRIAEGAAGAWREHLTDAGVDLERSIDEAGASRLYVRDPAGNSVELVAGEIWPA